MTHDPYLPPPPLAGQPRLVLWRIVLLVSIPVLLVLWAGWSLLSQAQTKRETVKPQTPLTAREADQPVTLPSSLHLQTSYLGVNRAPVVPPAPPAEVPAAPSSPPMVASFVPMATTAPPPLTHLAGTPTVPPTSPGQAPPVPAPPAGSVARRGPPAGTGPSAAPVAPKPPVKWMQPQVVVLASPFATGAKPQQGVLGRQERPGHAQERQGSLMTDALVEHPDDPTAVLYRDQVLVGALMDAVSSDVPGQVRIKITAPVYDRLGQRTVLIPQHSVLMAVQSDKTVYGQRRLPMRDLVVLFPDGGVLALEGSQVADQAGAAGVEGAVNNHYGKLLLAAGVSALLNIGGRAAVGNSSAYQPSFQQDLIQDVGQSVKSTGEKVVEKQLQVPPTIEAAAGTPVTVQLMRNYRLVK